MQLFGQRALTRSPGTKSRGHQSPISREPCRSPWSIRAGRAFWVSRSSAAWGRHAGSGQVGQVGQVGRPAACRWGCPGSVQTRGEGGGVSSVAGATGDSHTPCAAAVPRGRPAPRRCPRGGLEVAGPSDTAHSFWSLVFAQPLKPPFQGFSCFVSHGTSNVFWLLPSDVTGST